MPIPHLLLFDGPNMVNRYFHAPSDLPADESIGFALGRYQRMFRPSSALMVFDGDGPTWRHELHPDYKANRPPKPEGLAALFEATRASCRSWRLPYIEVPGVEADDMIGTYTEAAVERGWDVTIVSGDKDLTQLVRDVPQVRVHDDARKMVWGPDEVAAKFGVGPARVAEYLALVGDSSDNYGGIPGIGEKRAAALLERFDSMDALLGAAHLVWNKASREKLRGIQDAARLCLRLATLRCDLDLPIPLGSLRWSN